MLGNVISAVEVSLVSNQGFWLLADDEELFLAYADFPWFKQATIAQITQVERPTANHLYWPSLDIDLSLESVRQPSAFPLISTPNNH
ncbi:DUF2442 domain-containing protein [Methylotenera sp.]|uniref:DUF2442 domain-containing protein n=1 Tax=Methylotenera sp. TaxID=2051956 RepID=UPI002489E92A|nr:DUF2442 domain-containing protein [Methylotenera sp.]MDI1297767.1 DUF2442 domain-containing protein [Methylotenera sp.]